MEIPLAVKHTRDASKKRANSDHCKSELNRKHTLPITPSPSLAGTPSAGLPSFNHELQGASGFGGFLRWAQNQLEAPQDQVQVRQGDTLIGLAKRQAAQAGQTLSDKEAMRAALQTANANGISNPNLIFPGQNVEFSTLFQEQAAAVSASLGLSTQERLLAHPSNQTAHAALNNTLNVPLKRLPQRGRTAAGLPENPQTGGRFQF